MQEFDFHSGEVLLFDKPLGWSSFDLVKKVRNTINFKKIGHAGTLDPLATGLLILATGKKTKAIESIQSAPKTYTGTIKLGATTASYDLETPEENLKSTDHLTQQILEDCRMQFLGSITQLPPIFSAVKIDGQRAYKAARAGKEIKTKERTVQITSFTLTNISLPYVSFELDCSKGTYVRSLAYDFGLCLGVGGYLTALRRTKIGVFSVENAYQLDAFIADFNRTM